MSDAWKHMGGTRWSGPDGRVYSIEPMRITPEWANEMLNGNDGNKESRNFRRSNDKKVKKLASDMLAGRWKFNGAAVVIDDDGYPRDGQKRLEACIQTGVSFDAIVVWGIADGADLTIDTGEKRTVAQYLKYQGERNCTQLSAALTWLWKIQNNKELWADTPSTTEALLLLEENPAIRESVNVGMRVPKNCPESISAVVHYLCSRHDKGKADRFFDQLAKGTALAEDDPIRRFRDRMADMGKAKLPPSERAALLIMAWNKWVEGRGVRCLKWASIGPTAQPFPKITLPNKMAVAG